ncbi:MAG: zinc-binding alcohol dehydrogenase family protein [Gemmatimonadaceae bacterium]|nr:zinc-binding alcohol dehydrogenase family protein [Gemmatimonadaceae bacterium]
MDHLVVFGSRNSIDGVPVTRPRVCVDGVDVQCGFVPVATPSFDGSKEGMRGSVLVRVRGFSCNYRDKAFARSMRSVAPQRFSPIGSEYVAEVVAVGAEVTTLRPGDRVITDHHYVGRPWLAEPGGPRAGVASNQASRGYHVTSARKLRAIPPSMPDAMAAAFSLNAQTAYSMLRRLELSPGANVLVTSGASNTSQFALAALRQHPVNVFTVTSSARWAERLGSLGAHGVLVVGRHLSGFHEARKVTDFAEEVGGFDAIIDPFFDLHVEKVVEVMNPFGRYVTCGLVGQNEVAAHASGVASCPPNSGRLFTQMIMKNLTLSGNCIGVSSDLDAALCDHTRGSFQPVLDSVFCGSEAAGFLDRTFNDPDRFGKVAFVYDN